MVPMSGNIPAPQELVEELRDAKRSQLLVSRAGSLDFKLARALTNSLPPLAVPSFERRPTQRSHGHPGR